MRTGLAAKAVAFLAMALVAVALSGCSGICHGGNGILVVGPQVQFVDEGWTEASNQNGYRACIDDNCLSRGFVPGAESYSPGNGTINPPKPGKTAQPRMEIVVTVYSQSQVVRTLTVPVVLQPENVNQCPAIPVCGACPNPVDTATVELNADATSLTTK